MLHSYALHKYIPDERVIWETTSLRSREYSPRPLAVGSREEVARPTGRDSHVSRIYGFHENL